MSLLALVGVVLGLGLLSILALLLYPYAKNYKYRSSVHQFPMEPYKNGLLGSLENIPKDATKKGENLLRIMKQYNGYEAIGFIMGPNPLLMVVGPTLAKELLSSSRHTSKNFIYDGLVPWLGTGLLISKDEKWKVRRRMITPAFHFDILKKYLRVMNEQSDIMIARIRKQGDASFDMFEFVTSCALDIICETAMGKKVYAQHETRTSYVNDVYEMSRMLIQRAEKPYLINDFVFSLSPLGKKFYKTLKKLHDFTLKVISERKKIIEEETKNGTFSVEKKMAFLDMLLTAEVEGEPLTLEDIREEVDTFMFEGHDTTSASLAWTCNLIGSHPSVQQRLQEEVDSVVGDSTEVTPEMLAQLHFLENVIKESLRLYPSVPMIGRLLSEDVEFEGKKLPAGMSVLISIYACNHNPKYWDQPEVFNPDRWNSENVDGRNPYLYIPFAAGPRSCIGQRFAQYEEKVLLAKIIKNFELKSLNQNPRKLPELILRPCDGILMTAKPRF